MSSQPMGVTAGAMVLLLCGWTACDAANQTSATYRVAADVFCSAAPNLAVSGAKSQASVSVAQWSVVGRRASRSYGIDEGYQAATEGFDTDRDGIPDSDDPDDDNDGVPDRLDERPYDTDNDGLNNVAIDADDDNDTFSDVVENVFTGTDPVDAEDFLKVLDVRPSGTNAVVFWKSTAGKNRYWVERSLDLQGPTNWHAVAGPISATSGVTSIIDTNAAPHSFYRVTIPY